MQCKRQNCNKDTKRSAVQFQLEAGNERFIRLFRSHFLNGKAKNVYHTRISGRKKLECAPADASITNGGVTTTEQNTCQLGMSAGRVARRAPASVRRSAQRSHPITYTICECYSVAATSFPLTVTVTHTENTSQARP